MSLQRRACDPKRIGVSLHPLLSASWRYQVHAFLAFFALVLGVVQLVWPKGSTLHRGLGYGWVACMAIIALSSLLPGRIMHHVVFGQMQVATRACG